MENPSSVPLVVLVDDEPAVLDSLRRLLRHEACAILATKDPRDVLEWAARVPIDLVLVDHRMPHLTGGELVEILADRSPATMPILLTAYPDAVDLRERARGRLRALIAKPWKDEDLVRLVRSCLRRPGWANPPIPVDCAGRTRVEILSGISRALDVAPVLPEPAWIRLDNLGLAEDSVSRILGELAELAARLERRVVIADGSGLTGAFLAGGRVGESLLSAPPREGGAFSG